jgi:hypothetical protein
MPTPSPLFKTKLPKQVDLLGLLRLAPCFFSNPKTELSRTVNGADIINELRFWVSIFDQSQDQAAGNSTTGDIAVFFLQANRLHVESTFRLHRDVSEARVQDEPISSWGTLMASRDCFLYGVLGIRTVGTPVAVKLLPHLSALLLDDAESNISALLSDQCNPDLWIWKVFAAAVALLRFWDDFVELNGAQNIKGIQLSAKDHIEHWRRKQGVGHWYQFETALKRIVWPETAFDDALLVWTTTEGESARTLYTSQSPSNDSESGS